METATLANKNSRSRVLIVEDEALIAMSLEDVITELGYEVIGTAPSVEAAVSKIQAHSPDLGLLDLFLRDHLSYDVADLLLEKHIPFVIMSGSSEEILPRHATVTRLQKPCSDQELEKALRISAELTVRDVRGGQSFSLDLLFKLTPAAE